MKARRTVYCPRCGLIRSMYGAAFRVRAVRFCTRCEAEVVDEVPPKDQRARYVPPPVVDFGAGPMEVSGLDISFEHGEPRPSIVLSSEEKREADRLLRSVWEG